MNAQKVKMLIEVESLSTGTLRGQLEDVMMLVDAEIDSGELIMSDGDIIKWSITREPVEF